jgi:membrane protein DedA with SNARE-associated domain
VVTIMVARHTSGLRLAAYALAALNGARPTTFVMADGLSALISVPLVVSLGWLFADHIETVKRDLHGAELLVGLGSRCGCTGAGRPGGRSAGTP